MAQTTRLTSFGPVVVDNSSGVASGARVSLEPCSHSPVVVGCVFIVPVVYI